jgi:hypothetical protein
LAYSAAVQWYARLGQLPTADGMKDKGQRDDTRCQMGYNVTKDPHLIFIGCKAFNRLREDACREMVDKTKQKIQAIRLEEVQFTSLLQTAKFLFSDCSITWPLHYSSYYLGHILKLDARIDSNIFANRLKCKRFIHNVYGDWRMSFIRLPSCIWGKAQKEMTKRRDMLHLRH